MHQCIAWKSVVWLNSIQRIQCFYTKIGVHFWMNLRNTIIPSILSVNRDSISVQNQFQRNFEQKNANQLDMLTIFVWEQHWSMVTDSNKSKSSVPSCSVDLVQIENFCACVRFTLLEIWKMILLFIQVHTKIANEIERILNDSIELVTPAVRHISIDGIMSFRKW